jgi:L-aspartate oxidase
MLKGGAALEAKFPPGVAVRRSDSEPGRGHGVRFGDALTNFRISAAVDREDNPPHAGAGHDRFHRHRERHCGSARRNRACAERAGHALTKDQLDESNTKYAQGGVAVVLNDDDRIELHVQDTLDAGAGLCDEQAVKVLVEEGPRYILELIHHGASSTATRGCSRSRRRRRTRAGASCTPTATRRARDRSRAARLVARFDVDRVPRARVHAVARAQGRPVRRRHLHRPETQQVEALYGRAVVLATGGAGQLYEHTTNPDVATGDGMAMATAPAP